MGVYIYEGHMGSIYANHEPLSYDSLYCDECGDSDRELGYAENLAEAWELLKPITSMFDCSKCEGCKHNEDYDFCDNECEEYAKSGGYSFNHIMSFLHETFPKDERWEKIYLLIRPKNHPDYYRTGLITVDKKFGAEQFLPSKHLLKGENHNLAIEGLTHFVDEEVSKPILLKTITVNNQTVHIYECEAEVENGWNESAQYMGDGWYGYTKKETLCLVENDKLVVDAAGL